MALELAKHNPVYEDIASKFFEVRKHLSHNSTWLNCSDSTLFSLRMP
jgi:hypothetical protein